MTIISDTTPIISLIKINRLDLLEKLFEEVLIPEAVYRELTTNALFENEAKIVKTSSFLKTSSVQNRKSLQLLQAVSGLDDGESEAIILADELKSDVLIMDERKGRKVAEKLGIKITGTVGVLLQSYSENMISSDEIKTYLDQLKNSNIRLSESLIQKALEML
ncbi:MAG: DUF3368 domain-containing protein [Treponema sp.]|nr:DUF3368 domain-containing protein [Treponema sp.]